MNKVNSDAFDGRTLTLKTDGDILTLAFIGDGLLHLRRDPAERNVDDEDAVVVLPPAVSSVLEREDGVLSLTCGLLCVKINLNNFSVDMFRDGHFVAGTAAGRSLDTWSDGVTFRLVYGEDERVYGLGQDPMAQLDQRDRERRMWNRTDSFRKSGNNGIPFYVSSSGYGLFLNSFRPARFAVGAAKVADTPRKRADCYGLDPNPDPWSFDAPNPEQNPKEIAVLLDHPVLDIVMMFGSLDEVQGLYTKLTGRAALLPRWAFGLIQCKNRYRSMEELIAVATGYRKRGIPLDCLVIDWLWFKEFGDLRWDTENFPDPRGGIERLKALGVHFMLAQHPFIDRESLEYEKLNALGYLTKVPPHCRPTYDFTNEAARIYWWDNEIRPLFEDGVRGYWTDMGEPENDHPDTLYSVGSRERAHNSYALNWSRALYEGQRCVSDERLFILGRALSAGIHKYGTAHWSNDIEATFEVLADQVVQGQTVALSGQLYWCTDIGGFITLNGFSPELYIRWLEWGVFCTLFRTHGTRPDNEPWSFGVESEAIIADTVRLRYRLLPYIYSSIKQASLDGRPVVRAMALDFPDDQTAVTETGQFMFGSALLVAPVVREGERIRTLWLPKGVWYDFFTGERFEGGRYIDVAVPLNKIPVFARAGSIIPVNESPVVNACETPKEITLLTFPGAEGCFSLYDDDGLTYGYETGAYAETHFTSDINGNVDIQTIYAAPGILPEGRTYEVRLPSDFVKNPTVTCDCVMKSDGTVKAYLISVNGGIKSGTLVGLHLPRGFEGYMPEPETRGDITVYNAKFRPVSDYLPVRHRAEFIVTDGGESKSFPFTFGSGFASRFQIIGDFVNTDGIDTKTPVEDFPVRESYEDLRWFRRYKQEFNCMGYVYCWRDKIEDGPRPVSYAACSVYSAGERTAYIECSGDNELKIWLNSKAIFASRKIVLRQVLETPVMLKDGENKVLVKVVQNHPKPFSGRELGFSFRFTDEQGNPLEDLIYAPVI